MADIKIQQRSFWTKTPTLFCTCDRLTLGREFDFRIQGFDDEVTR